MKPEHWPKLDRLFHSALQRPTTERAAFVEQVCDDDYSLRNELEALLAAHQEAGSFIESPAIEVQSPASSISGRAAMAPGEIVSHYQIISLLGSGGMGDVYLAQDTILNRQAALKILPEHFTEDSDRLRRFQQEARTASALNHPNIITIYEIGEFGGRPFIVTEFIDGVTLREYCRRGRKEPVDLWLFDVFDIVIQTAEALEAAHEAHIVHRDIKPENIMLRRRDSYVKLLDFGLAKLTETETIVVDSEASTRARFETVPGIVLGTLSYMSPEQVRGEAVDERTDIWSLGVVLYEMVAGHHPFERRTPSEVIAMILEREPASLASGLPSELQRIVSKALTKDVHGRYESAKALLEDIRRLKQKLASGGEIVAGTASRNLQTRSALAAQSALEGNRTSPDGSLASKFSKYTKHHFLLASVLLAISFVIGSLYFFSISHRTLTPAPLTGKDSILIADFINRTGDEEFDGALKQGLAVQLEQSPFLNIFPDQRVHEVLASMNRGSELKLTRDLAREICERQGLKALIIGSVSPLGNQYVIGLEAVNAKTDEVFAREQDQAAGKEHVLTVLATLARRMREKLGESLSTIEKFDAPVEATTSSLQALRIYSEGRHLHLQGNENDAIPVLKSAVALDPKFAMAHTVLAATCLNLGKTEEAREYFSKAFELREHASQRERLMIEAQYHHVVTGNFEKAISSAELLKRLYPRDVSAHFMLGYFYGVLGQFDKAVIESGEATRLDPNWPISIRRLAIWLRHVGRYTEARETLYGAWQRNIEVPGSALELYYIALLQGDTAEMQRRIEILRSRDGFQFLDSQAVTAELAGQYRKARGFRAKQVEVLLKAGRLAAAGEQAGRNAEHEALGGQCEMAQREVAHALSIAHTRSSINSAAFVLAICGELRGAQAFADEYRKLTPEDTLANAVYLPLIEAAIANQRGNYTQAVELLVPAQPYDGADSTLLAHFIRGQALLAQRSGANALAEFFYVLDNRRIDPDATLYSLAQLGLARALAVHGDTERARSAYQDLFVIWKDADKDLAPLISAKKEYKELK